MRYERNFTHQEGDQSVNLAIIDCPTDADVAVMLAGLSEFSLARITVNHTSIGAMLIGSTNRSDVDRLLDLVGLLPEFIEDERWSLRE